MLAQQKIHFQLFEAFKLLFNTTRHIKTHRPIKALARPRASGRARESSRPNAFSHNERDKYAQFSLSSKTEIQTVINFFSFSGLHPLIGLKNIEYFKWLTSLQNSFRYKNLNFPK